VDRDAIERRDFPTARRGYDPAAVDANLRHLADEIERLGRAAGPPASGLAAGTSDQVRAILEAAEASAGQLRAEAGEEARGHVERVETAAADMVARLARLQEELDRLLDGLRASASVVTEGLLDLRARVEEMGGSVSPPEPVPAREVAAAEEPEAVAPEEPKPAVPDAPPPGERSTDEEGARLAALDMALSGRPREEAERYLAEHFELDDPAALLDEVYTRVGR
jgi:DivIVA domain-containing protein